MGEARIEHVGGWTEERVKTLTTMWNAGNSAGQIAFALAGGLTRSAVLGKVSRLKLPKHGKMVSTTSAQRDEARRQRVANAARLPKIRMASATPSLPPMPLLDTETDVGVDVTRRVGLMDLTNHTCRWPVGPDTGARQLFCGCRKGRDAGPYCPEHSERAGSGYGRPRP